MQLNLERPDYTWYLRGADGSHALVNDRTLDCSFAIAPDALVEDWPVRDAKAMTPADLEPLLALQPELIVLGTGETQRFPAAAVLGASLSRGIGIEVMTNAAAARTYSVLAGEGRRVVAGFIFPGR
jgi:uncharacterized protein